MSDINFTCPNCGQPLISDDGQAGQIITCPACQKAATIPFAGPGAPALPPPLPPPVSGTPGAGSPPIIPGRGPVRPAGKSGSNVAIIVALVAGGLLLLFVLGIAGLFVVRSTNAPRPVRTLERQPGHGIRVARPETLPQSPAGDPASDQQVATDPARVAIPSEPLRGTLGGTEFVVQHGTLVNGILTLKGGKGFSPEMIIFTFQRGDLAEKTILIPHVETDMRRPAPHVHLRWEENGRTKSEVMTGKYAMRLEFGQEQGGKLPGRLYLESPERLQTKLAGTFEAELTQRR